jgi:hypothetical protein
MAGVPDYGFSNPQGTRRCRICKRRRLRSRYGKLQFHFATGACPTAEICEGGHIPIEELQERAKVHPRSCGCEQKEEETMSIQPRTVSVSVEINDTDFSMKDIKDTVRQMLEDAGIGRIRTVSVNVIQGSRKKGKAKAKRKKAA